MIRDGLRSETGKILKRHERDIVHLNYNQMIDGYGSDNRNLFNALKEFDGVYSPGYKKSGLYDFFETGHFKRGLFARISNGQITVDSTGKGSGEKSLFFAGYTNLFGLNDDSEKKLREIITPELKKYIYEKSK